MADPVRPTRPSGAAALFVVPTAGDLSRAAAGRLWGIVRERAAARRRERRETGPIHVALSGGGAQVAAYAALAGEPYRGTFPWEAVHFWQVDERWVPPESGDSNRRKLEEALFSRVPVPPESLHLIDTSLPGAPEGARRYEEEMRRFFPGPPGRFPRFDAMILGIGADGHTASLFPGSEAVREESAWAVAVKGGDPFVDRVTLTLPVLNAAGHAVFVVGGEKKAGVLSKVLSPEGAALPAARVSPARGRAIILADAAAASRLARGGGGTGR